MGQSFLIIGASSDIALELGQRLLDKGNSLTLLARDLDRVQPLVDQGAHLIHGDALDAESVQSAVDKAKEAGKKISKSKSMISMARKLMAMSDKYDDETRANAESQIEEIEKKLAEGNGTRAFSLAEKLNKYLEG